METHRTVVSPAAEENHSFLKGQPKTGSDGSSGPAVPDLSVNANLTYLQRLARDSTAWGYVLVHNKRAEWFEQEVNRCGQYRCFVHRTVYYRKSAHGVKKLERPSVSGYVFLQGKSRDLQCYLNEHFSSLHLVKDRTTHAAAVIPDSQMQPFMRLMEEDPLRVRILEKPIGHYAKGNTKVEVGSGVLKGLQGYYVRIARDRKLVINVGGIAVAISNVYKDDLEALKNKVESPDGHAGT